VVSAGQSESMLSLGRDGGTWAHGALRGPRAAVETKDDRGYMLPVGGPDPWRSNYDLRSLRLRCGQHRGVPCARTGAASAVDRVTAASDPAEEWAAKLEDRLDPYEAIANQVEVFAE
jgi:hypothetical protein